MTKSPLSYCEIRWLPPLSQGQFVGARESQNGMEISKKIITYFLPASFPFTRPHLLSPGSPRMLSPP